MVGGAFLAVDFSDMRARFPILFPAIGVPVLCVGIFFLVFLLEKKEDAENDQQKNRFQKVEFQTENEELEIARKDRFLESPFISVKLYEEAFRNAKRNVTHLSGRPIAGITSHHFLARDLIAGTVLFGSSPNVTRVIIVGPDHFEVEYPEGVIAFTSRLPWRTPFGEMLADPLFSSAPFSTVAQNDAVFFREHSIYTLVPFVKYFFPHASIAPIILKNTRNIPEKFEELGREIAENSGDEKTFVLVSSDFSHDVSVREARVLDKKSIAFLETFPVGGLSSVTNDCRSCLAFLMGYLEGKSVSFSLIENKTSADFGGDEKSVTSYVSGIFVEQGN